MTVPARLAFRLVRRTATVALALAALSAFPLLPVARAEDGGDEGQDVSAKIKAQMEKIIRLMRENERALLAASQGGGSAPKPVDVKPPEGSSGTPPPGPTPPGMEGDAPKPGERGEDIRRRMEELIEGSEQRGQRIPMELEELIRMIPQQQGQGSSPDGQDPSGKPLPKPEDAEARKAGEKAEKPDKPQNGKDPSGAEKDPKTPAGQRTGTSDKPPAGGAEGDPRKDGVPAWITELPPEIRKMLTAGEVDKIPDEFRPLIQKYLDYLQKQAKDAGR